MLAITRLLIFAPIFLLLACAGPGHHDMTAQFQTDHGGPVYSIQGYVYAGSADQLRKAWQALAREMEKQDGFISARLSDGLGNSKLVLAHSEWRSLEDLRTAFTKPQILELEGKMPVSKRKFEHLFALGSSGSQIKNGALE